jgi:hypothetical protein
MKTVWLVASSIVVQVSLNINTLLAKNSTTNEDAKETIIAAALSKSNQLY